MRRLSSLSNEREALTPQGERISPRVLTGKNPISRRANAAALIGRLLLSGGGGPADLRECGKMTDDPRGDGAARDGTQVCVCVCVCDGTRDGMIHPGDDG